MTIPQRCVEEAAGPAGELAEQVRYLDHVAVLVEDMREPVTLFHDLLGATLLAGGDNDLTGTRMMHLRCGGFKIELMQPLRPDSPVAPRLRQAGPGFHHLTIVVGDLLETISSLDLLGRATVGHKLESTRWREAFLRPRETFGTLIQFVDTTLRWDVPTSSYDVEDVLAGRVVWKDYVACLRR